MRRIYGIIGTDVNNGMFNADFTGGCRRNFNGELVHSDVSLKYCFRNQWFLREGADSVLAYTKYDENLNPLTLEKNFSEKFPKSEKTKSGAKSQLLTYRDVKNFGIAFAVKSINISLTGPVQIGWGININELAEEKTIQISSPFSSKEGNGQTTLGTQNIVENALFIAPFVATLSEEYNEEDFKNFVDISKTAVTNTQSRSMIGCNSAFSLVVELESSIIATDFLMNRISLKDNKLTLNFDGLRLKKVNLYVNLYKYEVEILNASVDVNIENLF